MTAGLSLGREGPSVQIGSYVGCLVSKWTRVLAGERKQLLAAEQVPDWQLHFRPLLLPHC